MSDWYFLELLFLTAANTLWQDAQFETVIKLTALFSTGHWPQPKFPMFYAFLIIRFCKICMERGGLHVKTEGLCITKRGFQKHLWEVEEKKDPAMMEKTSTIIRRDCTHRNDAIKMTILISYLSQNVAALYFLYSDRKTRVWLAKAVLHWVLLLGYDQKMVWNATTTHYVQMIRWGLPWGRQRIGASTLYVHGYSFLQY